MLTVAKGGTTMACRTAIVWATENTAAALHAQDRAEAVAEVRTRLHALWLLRRGKGRPRWRPWWRADANPCSSGCAGTGPEGWPAGRSTGPSAGRSGQVLLPDAGPGRAGLDRGAVRGGLHRGQPVHAAAAAGNPSEGAPVAARKDGPPGPDTLEKGGLGERLAAVGLKVGPGTVWGDEMRVGLRGQGRKVWAPGGVAVAQEVQPGWS